MKKALPHYIIAFVLSQSIPAFGTVFCQNPEGKTIYTEDRKQCVDPSEVEFNQQSSDYETHSNFSKEIPSLLQTKQNAGFTDSGLTFCGPVAVSNSLVWLEKNSSEAYQIELVKKLSSSKYMNTTAQGTNVRNLMHGVHQYAIERWGRYGRLEYSGWSKVPNEFHSNLLKPTLNWLINNLHQDGAVWLNIGWYQNDHGNYERTGGHWVTLVGYENGKLIIHDPAFGDQNGHRRDFISLTALASGKLIDGKFKTDAKDYYLLNSLDKKWNVQAAILDGAVVFTL